MALSHTSLTWVQSAKICRKKLSKKLVLDVDLVFCTMSDSCRFHGPFMALSSFWLLLFFQTVLWHLHGRFMADSWRFHGTFLALSRHFSLWVCLDLPWKCHGSAINLPNLDETFMSDSRQFVSVYFCLFVLSVFLMLSSLMVFEVQVDQFFWGFLWSKYRAIRNTQTTNRNPQLVFSWPKKPITPLVQQEVISNRQNHQCRWNHVVGEDFVQQLRFLQGGGTKQGIDGAITPCK